MARKDFTAGMEAGAKPFEQKFKAQADAVDRLGKRINAKLEDISDIQEEILSDLSARERKELYDLNTAVDIADLDDSEKEFLLAVLYTLANMTTEVTPHQQSYVRSVKNYLQIRNVQTGVDLSAIENIDSKKAEKAILQCVMEFLFLENCNHNYWDEYDDVLDYFSVKNSEIRKIQNSIDAIYKATGADGLSEKYGFVASEEADDTPCGSDNQANKAIVSAYQSISLKDAEKYCKPSIERRAILDDEFARVTTYFDTAQYLVVYLYDSRTWIRVDKLTHDKVDLPTLTQFSENHSYATVDNPSNSRDAMFSENHCVDYYANTIYIRDEHTVYAYYASQDSIEALDWFELPGTFYETMHADGRYFAASDRENGLLCVDLLEKKAFYLADDDGNRVVVYSDGQTFGLRNGKIYLSWWTKNVYSTDGYEVSNNSITEFDIQTKKSKRIAVATDLGREDWESVGEVFSFRNKVFIYSEYPSITYYQMDFSGEKISFNVIFNAESPGCQYSSANYLLNYNTRSYELSGVNIDTSEQFQLGTCYELGEPEGFFSKKRPKFDSKICIAGRWVYCTQSYTDVLSGDVSLGINREEMPE